MSQTRLSVLPPLPLSVHLRRPCHRPFPLDEAGCSLHALGRHAIWQGVKTLGLTAGDEILVPAYHHGSEIEALVRAELGCRFYGLAEGLEPDEAELDALIGRRTRALLLIHYLGFPQDGPRWRSWCDERGLVLIEDAAQAWLGSFGGLPLGSFGDISIFCLYKTFGLPEGGALLARARPAASDSANGLGLGRLIGRHRSWLLARSAWLARLGAALERERPYSPDQDFALGDPRSRPSIATTFLLPRLADPEAARRRRANYQLLLERLGDLVPQPFAVLPDGASPFVFPVETSKRDELLSRLALRGIEANAFWSVPHPSLPVSRFGFVQSLRARVVALPVHQELRPQDIERLSEALG
jgi:dTDP-4-amino-4,6-dideoxygalactose transaminase